MGMEFSRMITNISKYKMPINYYKFNRHTKLFIDNN